jgi:hypothetical protein
MTNRVTRLGEPGASRFHLFSHFHHLTTVPQRLPPTLGSFIKSTEGAQNLLPTFFLSIYLYYVIFWQNIGWATLWAIVSQTHLVSLLGK